MMLFALWYYHSPEGRRFLEGREIRLALMATGIIAAYFLLRNRPPFSHTESRRSAIARMIMAVAAATLLWLCMDWIRGENWIIQLATALPQLDENVIRYSVLFFIGWLAWSIAIFEGMRRMVIRRRHNQAKEL